MTPVDGGIPNKPGGHGFRHVVLGHQQRWQRRLTVSDGYQCLLYHVS